MSTVLWALATITAWAAVSFLVIGVWVAVIEFNGWRHR